MIRVLPRALVYLRRIADALDRLAPSPPRRPQPVTFSIATDDDFLRGHDARSRYDAEGS